MPGLFRSRTHLELERRIDLFANLPLDSRDWLNLQTQLDAPTPRLEKTPNENYNPTPRSHAR
jgi:hypothetical protein